MKIVFLGAFSGVVFLLTIQLIFSLGGGWIAWSPNSWLVALGSYLSVGVLLNSVFARVANTEAEQFGAAKADDGTLETAAYIAVAFAVAPVFWVFGTNLDWDKFYFCSNYYVQNDDIWNISKLLAGEDPGGYAQAILRVEEKQCLSDPADYFSEGGFILNEFIYYIAWIYSIILVLVVSFLLNAYRKGISDAPGAEPVVSLNELPRWKMNSPEDASDSEMIDCMEVILDNIKAATRKAEAKKLVSEFEYWTPIEHVNEGRNDYSAIPTNARRKMSSMYRDVIKILPTLYSPKEIEKGIADRRVSKLNEVLKKIESTL